MTLREHYGPTARLAAVEAVPEQAVSARANGAFDEVFEGYFPEALSSTPETFDLVTFNDVLEHIVEPWVALNHCHERLTSGGRVLATIPNVAYAPVVLDLVKGRWDYQDEGVLDRTHVRFFTRKTMVELFEDAGFAVDVCVGVNPISGRWATDPLAPRRYVKRLVARALGDRQYLHFVVIGRSRETR